MRPFLSLLLALVLLGCDRAPPPELPPPSPAIWEVTAPDGSKGWLFGTVHSLPTGMDWRSRPFDQAFAQADTLLVELRDLDNRQAMAQSFRELAVTKGLPTLSQRIPARKIKPLLALLKDRHLDEGDLQEYESWAVSVILAQSNAAGNPENGVDRAILRDAGPRKVIELEGLVPQLGLFDHLPEKEQTDLLVMTIDEELAQPDGNPDPYIAWRAGDTDAILEEAERSLLTDPELSEALLYSRNRAFVDRFKASLAAGDAPMMAVGTLHLIGPKGVGALLTEQGYAVRPLP